MSFINENQLVSEFDKLNISSKDSYSVEINHENCHDPNNKKILNTIYDAREEYIGGGVYYPSYLEWVSFDRSKNIKQVGEDGFAKVYSATWVDGITKYTKQDDGNWIKCEPKSIKVALKRLMNHRIRAFTFKNLSKPINSHFIATTYFNEDNEDFQLVDLDISNSLILKDDDFDN
ncbi:hypothetical protein C1646_754999 [Rhizophagus diaphanus]|nr:hypothetical protein C1646_754999 [Rhizophagus diaphanus] [Rhizophagus sp. MUCL 43196]